MKASIKIAITLLTVILLSIEHKAQNFKKLDESPHDISYFRESKITPPMVKVVYGRPSLKSKKAFGDQVPFNKLWRTGANEATEVQFFQDVKFGDQLVKAGTYVLVTIPGEKQWEIILSENLDVWGAYQYDPSKNVATIKVAVHKAEKLDVFSIDFKRKENAILMVLGWDRTRVKIPLNFSNHASYAKL